MSETKKTEQLVGLYETAGGLGHALERAREAGLADLREMGAVCQVGTEGLPYAVMKDGFRMESLEKYLPPQRTQKVTFDEVDSFIDYVNDMQDARSRLFCSMGEHQIVAVLDYHLPAVHAAHAQSEENPHGLAVSASAKRHIAVLQLKTTHEHDAWKANNNKTLLQAAFAEFLEDRALEVLEPGPADILDIARTLQAKPDLEFKSAQRSHDQGFNLTYIETVTARAGQSGELEVPSQIVLRLPLFQGGEPVAIRARLRYRIDSGALCFSYRFLRYEEAVREQLQKIRTQVIEATKLRVHSGTLG